MRVTIETPLISPPMPGELMALQVGPDKWVDYRVHAVVTVETWNPPHLATFTDEYGTRTVAHSGLYRLTLAPEPLVS